MNMFVVTYIINGQAISYYINLD